MYKRQWYAYNGDKIGQGRENAKIFLKEHTDICDEIEKQVRIHYHLLPDEEGQAKEPVPATGDAPDALSLIHIWKPGIDK